MAEAQARILRAISAHRASTNGDAVLVTHAELIRAAVLHSRGLPISAWDRVEIAPASVTTIAVRNDRIEVLSLNERVGG